MSRITVSPEICGGRPVVRSMRIRVSDILDLLAAGESRQSILADYPYLEDEDIAAALEHASAAATSNLALEPGVEFELGHGKSLPSNASLSAAATSAVSVFE